MISSSAAVASRSRSMSITSLSLVAERMLSKPIDTVDKRGIPLPWRFLLHPRQRHDRNELEASASARACYRVHAGPRASARHSRQTCSDRGPAAGMPGSVRYARSDCMYRAHAGPRCASARHSRQTCSGRGSRPVCRQRPVCPVGLHVSRPAGPRCVGAALASDMQRPWSGGRYARQRPVCPVGLHVSRPCRLARIGAALAADMQQPWSGGRYARQRPVCPVGLHVSRPCRRAPLLLERCCTDVGGGGQAPRSYGIFSPASIGTGSRFSAGGSGQVARSV